MSVSMRKHIMKVAFEREVALTKGESTNSEPRNAEAQPAPSPRQPIPARSHRSRRSPSYAALGVRIALVVFVTIGIFYGANQAMVTLLR